MTGLAARRRAPSSVLAGAIAHHRGGNLAQAVAGYGAALSAHSDDPTTLVALADALRQLGRRGEADRVAALAAELTRLQRRVAAERLCAEGVALHGQAQPEAAIACFRRALDIEPQLAAAHSNLGALLGDRGEPDAAMAHLRRAVALQPDHAEAWCNLGIAQRLQGAMDEAVASARRACALQPDNVAALNNLGEMLIGQGHAAEAEAVLRRAIALCPDSAETHMNLAMLLLASGAFAEGWREYEWRWQTRQMRPSRRSFPQPQWRGELAEGLTLLLHGEQGFGDTLQFCRYATLAAARGLKVIVEAPRPLLRLLRSLDGVAQVVACGDALPAFDLHCPMLSMPLAFGTSLDDIPAPAAYLRADADAVAQWAARIPATGLRVGLVWAGSARSHDVERAAIDRRRSLDPARMLPLFAIPGVQFFSLQMTGPEAPADLPLVRLMHEMADFADTASLVTNLDLVISVDTAVAHLAAALGKPVWLLDRFDPCWRWLSGRSESPWYPSLRIYRQPSAGAWDDVVAAVAADLRALTQTSPANPVPPALEWPDQQA